MPKACLSIVHGKQPGHELLGAKVTFSTLQLVSLCSSTSLH